MDSCDNLWCKFIFESSWIIGRLVIETIIDFGVHSISLTRILIGSIKNFIKDLILLEFVSVCSSFPDMDDHSKDNDGWNGKDHKYSCVITFNWRSIFLSFFSCLFCSNSMCFCLISYLLKPFYFYFFFFHELIFGVKYFLFIFQFLISCSFSFFLLIDDLI